MEQTIALIGIPGSILVDEIATRLSGASFPIRTLTLEAPFEGKPMTIGRGAVSWEGVDLLSAGAVFIERSVFPWPQTRYPAEYEESGFTQAQWAIFQREAASLVVSALHLASTACPVINPPSTAHLAVSPSIALDLLAREGIAVHPWRVEPVPGEDRSGVGILIDACGRDLRHTPLTPPAGETALAVEPFQGPVTTCIVIGGRAVGAVRFSGLDSWALGRGAEVAAMEGDAADLAVRSVEALGLGFAAVSLRADPGRSSVVLLEASPDLEWWDGMLGERVAEALAEHLIALVRRAPSDTESSK